MPAAPCMPGGVVKLATKTAELHVDQPVAVFSNLKLHLLHPIGERVPGELFAKVVETRPAEASRVVVHFTSIPEETRTFLDTVRGSASLVRFTLPDTRHYRK